MPNGLGASNQTSIGCNIRPLRPVVNISLGANCRWGQGPEYRISGQISNIEYRISGQANLFDLFLKQKSNKKVSLTPSSSRWLGPRVGSHQFFKKVDIFPQQLIDHLADILAFLPSKTLKFVLQFRV